MTTVHVVWREIRQRNHYGHICFRSNIYLLTGDDMNCNQCTSPDVCDECNGGFFLLETTSTCTTCDNPGFYSYVDAGSIARCGACLIFSNFIVQFYWLISYLCLNGWFFRILFRSNLQTCQVPINAFHVLMLDPGQRAHLVRLVTESRMTFAWHVC
jgi:hypothetical protein